MIEKILNEIHRLKKELDGYSASEGLDYIESYINSLQQKQPIQVNTLTWKDINDLERIINNVHYEFRAGIGKKSFGEEVLERFREERNEQEQPEVDLLQEFDDFLERNHAYVNDDEVISYYNGDTFNHTYDIYPIAKHFFNLRLQSQKGSES